MAISYEELHQLIHLTEHNPNETLMVALDMKELLLMVAGLTLLWNLQPCLSSDVDDLAYRMDELMNVQWEDPDEDS